MRLQTQMDLWMARGTAEAGYRDMTSGVRTSLARFVLATAMVAGWPCLAQQDANLECVEELGVPRYTYMARRSPNGGEVSAVVTIGPAGTAVSVETRSESPHLAEEVRSFLQNATKFKKGCESQKVRLRFTFQMQGEPEWQPIVFVKFRPPNHFIIVSSPLRPRI